MRRKLRMQNSGGSGPFLTHNIQGIIRSNASKTEKSNKRNAAREIEVFLTFGEWKSCTFQRLRDIRMKSGNVVCIFNGIESLIIAFVAFANAAICIFFASIQRSRSSSDIFSVSRNVGSSQFWVSNTNLNYTNRPNSHPKQDYNRSIRRNSSARVDVPENFVGDSFNKSSETTWKNA